MPRLFLFAALAAIAFAQRSGRGAQPPNPAAAKQAQTPEDRVLYLSRPAPPQEVHEIATIIHTIAEIQNVPVDETRGSLTLHGTAAQVSLAEWLFTNLNQPPSPSSMQEYPLPGRVAETVRLYALTPSLPDQEFQEIATLTRTISDVRVVATENAQKIFAIRAPSSQASLVDWIVKQLDPPSLQTAHMAEYPGSSNSPVRIYRIANSKTDADFQALCTLVRTVSNIRTAFTENTQRAFAIRGDASQMSMTDWLLDQLDQPIEKTPPRPVEYRTPGGADDVVGLLFFPNVNTAADFQAVTTQIRTATGINTGFVYAPMKALALRGTSNQLALAERLIP